MQISFHKVQSLSCDYIVPDDQEALAATPALLARLLSDRYRSVGAKGLLLHKANKKDIFVRCFREDGTEVRPPEEALRALAAHVVLTEGMQGETLRFAFSEGDRLLHVRRAPNGILTEGMLPSPDFEPTAAGVRRSHPLLGQPVEVRGFAYPLYALSLGDLRFAVCFDFGTSLDRLRTTDVGVPLTVHPLFVTPPITVFVTVHAPDRLSLRLWEPDTGEPPASLDAAAAALAVACLLGRSPTREDVSIRMRGGTLHLSTESIGGSVSVTAPATRCFHGTMQLDELTGDTT